MRQERGTGIVKQLFLSEMTAVLVLPLLSSALVSCSGPAREHLEPNAEEAVAPNAKREALPTASSVNVATEIAIHVGGRAEDFPCYYEQALNYPFPRAKIILTPANSAAEVARVRAKGLEPLALWGAWGPQYSDADATYEEFVKVAAAGYDFIFLDEFIWGQIYYQKKTLENAINHAVIALTPAIERARAIRASLKVIMTEPFFSHLNAYLREELSRTGMTHMDYVGGEDYGNAGPDSIRQAQLDDLQRTFGVKRAQWAMGSDKLLSYLDKVEMVFAADLLDGWGHGRVGNWYLDFRETMHTRYGVPMPPRLSCGCAPGEKLPKISDLNTPNASYSFRFRGDFDGDFRQDQGAIRTDGRALVTSARDDSFCWWLKDHEGRILPGSALAKVVTGDFDSGFARCDNHDDIRGLRSLPDGGSFNYSWRLLGADAAFVGYLHRSANPPDGYVPVQWLSKVVAGDFDGDGCDEMRGFQNQPPGANYWYDWGAKFYLEDPMRAWAPLRSGTLRNTAGGVVPIDQLRFLLKGDFDADGRDEVRGLQAYTSRNYIWGTGELPEREFGLLNRSNQPVPVDWLRFVVAGDFNGDRRDEIRGLQAGTSWSYAWGLNPQAVWDGPLLNSSGSAVPVDWLTDAFVTNFVPTSGLADATEELTAILPGDPGWWYTWGLPPATNQPPTLLLNGALAP